MVTIGKMIQHMKPFEVNSRGETTVVWLMKGRARKIKIQRQYSKTFNRFSTKDSYTGNITNNTGSTAD